MTPPDANTIAIILTGRSHGRLPGTVLDLPEAEARIIILSKVGRPLTDVITETKNGYKVHFLDGTTKTYKTAAGARKALENRAP